MQLYQSDLASLLRGSSIIEQIGEAAGLVFLAAMRYLVTCCLLEQADRDRPQIRGAAYCIRENSVSFSR